jgi:ATP-binding cassette subfamily B protein
MNNLKRITPFLRPYRLVLTLNLLTTFLPAAMELIVPRFLRYIIDQGITVSDMAVIWRGAGWMLATAVIGTIATLAQGYYRAQLSQGLAYDLRDKLFGHIQSLSFANLDQMQTGQLMTRLSSDVDMLRLFFSAGLSLLLRALLMIIGSVVLMALTDWQLTLIVVVLLPLSGLIIWAILRLVQPMFMVVQQKLGALNTIVQENLAGVQVVKAFVRERFEIDRFAGFNSDYRDENIHVGRLMAMALPALTILTNVGLVAVLWFGGTDAIGGRLTVGELVAFNNYLMIGMSPLLLLSNVLSMLSRAESSSARVWELLDTEPAVKTAVSPHSATSLQGSITFNDVAFHYNGVGGPQNGQVNGRSGGEDVLRELNFAVRPGQRVALLGATGSGKSSLVNLIPRFYDAHRGQICIDGIDVRDWEPEALRKRIGVVLQQTTIFSGTIRENIAYGRPTASLDEVIAAAQAAQAHDFIMRLPNGYDSEVEERGANLSGGQKQRLAIARALLIAPDILILDDSTSAVDLETEFKIQQALDERLADTTTFIVAQRISSVLNADQILVLDRGRITAQGTHAELLNSSPIYQEIYHSQLGRD